MKYDLGINSGTIRRYYRRNVLKRDRFEFAVLALTPGIPSEWLRQVCRLKGWRAYHSREFVAELYHEALPHALENAGTVTMENGETMLKLALATKRFEGAIPHWSALWLREKVARDGWKATREELNISHNRIQRWRTSAFHPLTLQRIVGPTGRNRLYGATKGLRFK